MAEEYSTYVLDTFALIAHLEGESGMTRVRDLLQSAEMGDCNLYISIINLGEVLYITERQYGLKKAQDALAAIRQLPIEILPVDDQTVFAAAHIQANYRLSYTDAFAVTAAQGLNGVLVTGDPEFAPVEKIIQLEWLEKGKKKKE
jgi:ribonuclease VapC